ncbi:MAG TPA: metallophosphoesterase family protein [Tepidiformaceae bacterium]|nr:metallophosphoesterase family protein [Tepidiformaceae bacterium]
MRVLLVSDIHSNLAALNAVLASPAAVSVDAVWHMGDVVGYGPQPNEVVAHLSAIAADGVLGNHDAAAIGALPLDNFNPRAAEAARWTARALTDVTVDALASLPEVRTSDDVVRVHGTLANPLWEYLTTSDQARAHFALQQTPISVVGHTHLPVAIELTAAGHVLATAPGDADRLELGEGRWVLNPGSVGQPRDLDPRASCAILDLADRSVTFHRVAYDIAETQRRIVAAALPVDLATRLSFGR